MTEADPIAGLLARVAAEHHFGNPQGGTAVGSTCECSCGEMNRSQGTRGMALNKAFAHLGEEQAAALRAAGHVIDGAEVEWAVVDNGRTIHLDGATCPADVMALTHGHGTHGPVGVAHRTVHRSPWQHLNENVLETLEDTR